MRAKGYVIFINEKHYKKWLLQTCTQSGYVGMVGSQTELVSLFAQPCQIATKESGRKGVPSFLQCIEAWSTKKRLYGAIAV